jgi:hypothetical protein
MDATIKAHLENLQSGEVGVQGEAFSSLMQATDGAVDWAYEAWDDLVVALRHKNNRVRAIAAQVLCNLAKSDPEARMLVDLDELLAVTRDERFVTARHCLLSLWKVGAAGPRQKKKLVEALAGRFADCAAEKNCTLIRYDIIQGLKQLYDLDNDEAIRGKAFELIEREEDPKYRKKYATVWRAK